MPLGDGACHKRHGVNMVVDICHGEYVMSLDAHCMVAKGFDERLAKDHGGDNWVQIPRRYKLDAENWTIKSEEGRPPIDYEYVMFPLNYHRMSGSPKDGEDYHPALHGWRWDARSLARKDIPIDDTMIFQGSCWFMKKDYFRKMGFMQVEGYSGWGQEAEELSFSTWLGGGRVVTNKNTWYAHFHKNAKNGGRMYFMSKSSVKKCNNYSYDFWVNNRWKERIHDFEWLIEKFWPIPEWPENWKQLLYSGKWSQ
jgi:hypothetical protein